jgi:hypothetical protein
MTVTLKVTCPNKSCPIFLDTFKPFEQSLEVNYDNFRWDVDRKKYVKIIRWTCPHCKFGYKWEMVRKDEDNKGDTGGR